MPFAEDQHVIEALTPKSAHEPLGKCVLPRRPDAAEHDLDPGVREHRVKQAGELPVAIPDQEPRPAPGILKIHDQLPRSLDNPACNGMSGRSQDADPPADVLDDRQHVQADAAQGHGLEEIAGQQGPGLGAEETGPGGEVRSGAGSIPACCSISHTVEAAILIPRTSSSPWMRR
jgi:hypothetical protein